MGAPLRRQVALREIAGRGRENPSRAGMRQDKYTDHTPHVKCCVPDGKSWLGWPVAARARRLDSLRWAWTARGLTIVIFQLLYSCARTVGTCGVQARAGCFVPARTRLNLLPCAWRRRRPNIPSSKGRSLYDSALPSAACCQCRFFEVADRSST